MSDCTRIPGANSADQQHSNFSIKNVVNAIKQMNEDEIHDLINIALNRLDELDPSIPEDPCATSQAWEDFCKMYEARKREEAKDI